MGTFYFVNPALLLSLKLIIPLLLFSALLTAGTLLISSTVFPHKRLPRHFTLAGCLTFGILNIVTAALLLLVCARRFNQRSSEIHTDREANRPQPTVHMVGSRSRTISTLYHQPNHISLKSNIPRAHLPAPLDMSRRQLKPRRYSPPPSNDHVAFHLPVSDLPLFPEAGMPVTKQPSLENEYEANHTFLNGNIPRAHLPAPLHMPRHQLKRTHRHSPPPSNDHAAFHLPIDDLPLFPEPRMPVTEHQLKPPRRHSPPPSNDHAAYHLPVYDLPLFPKAEIPVTKQPSLENEFEPEDIVAAAGFNSKAWWEEK